jgi:hypothetical protein
MVTWLQYASIQGLWKAEFHNVFNLSWGHDACSSEKFFQVVGSFFPWLISHA